MLVHLPPSLSFIWITNGERRHLDQKIEGNSLRNDSDLYVPLGKFIYLDNKPIHIYGFPKLWIAFDDNQIKLITSKDKFNSKLHKSIFFTNLKTTMSATGYCAHIVT